MSPRTVQYYEDILKNHGSQADDFVRLFMVPGLHHCTGGPRAWNFGGRGQRALKEDAEHDIMVARDRWVEQGVPPARIVGVKYTNDDPAQGVARTRPHCPYPQVARYSGSGSIDEASSFVCAARD